MIHDIKSRVGEMDKSCNFLSAKFNQQQELQSTKGKASNIASEIKTVKQDTEKMKKNINEPKNEIDEIAQYLRGAKSKSRDFNERLNSHAKT